MYSRILLGVACGSLLWVPSVVSAQTVHESLQETVRAEVVGIVAEREREIVGTDTTALVQTIEARILEGVREGEIVQFENDRLVLETGDDIFLNRLVSIEDREYFELKDVNRHGALISLLVFFVIVLALVAGRQGLRAFASLIASITVIIFVLIPALLAGYNPIVTSVLVAGVILALALFATHGFTARSVIAFLGTFGAVVLTGLIALIWVDLARFTGFGSDAAVYLNFSTAGTLDLSGLLLGAILIGILGVLDDVAVTQASVTIELARANRKLSSFELYRRALRVGRDHIGSLVNTLALAYVGVSLPLLLLFAHGEAAWGMALNQEIIAAELVRTLVGSIGLILAVPITTLIAVIWIRRFGISHEGSHGHSHENK